VIVTVVPEPLCLVKRTAAITPAAPPPAATHTHLFLYQWRCAVDSGWACAELVCVITASPVRVPRVADTLISNLPTSRGTIAGAAAWPRASDLVVKEVPPPANVPPGPLAGKVNTTVAPSTGKSFRSRISTTGATVRRSGREFTALSPSSIPTISEVPARLDCCGGGMTEVGGAPDGGAWPKPQGAAIRNDRTMQTNRAKGELIMSRSFGENTEACFGRQLGQVPSRWRRPKQGPW